MQRLIIGSAASSLRRCPRRQLLLATSHVSTNNLLHARITSLPPYPIHPDRPGRTLQIQSINNFSTASGSGTTKKSSPEKNLGIIGRIRKAIRTIFGANDDTPRGIQERKDMFWIVLAVAHRKLRVENQRQLLQNHSNDSATVPQPSHQLMWHEESKERLKELMEEAVSDLDENSDIGEMPLRRLRNEMQTLLEPQIVQLLNAAHEVDEKMKEENDDYVFSTEEELECKDILLREYDNVCQLIEDWKGTNEVDKTQRRTSDPTSFYEIKKGGIETLLTYFDWWPEGASLSKNNSANTDEEEYEDEFGFSPNKSDSELVGAMRYYHVRNLVRSSLVRRARDNDDSNNNSDDNSQPRGFNSLLPFKSTIPSAGRGVYVDGFAPAGSLLAFFPGQVWPKEHLMSTSLRAQMQFDQDPRHQLSMRYDDILIDSRQSPYTVVKNLWAFGHIFNHPPAPTATSTSSENGTSVIQSGKESEKEDSKSDNITNPHPHQGPNCITYPINFTNQMFEGKLGDKLQDYIPNKYEHPPKEWAKNALNGNEIIMHGMALVSLRDVKDEELFYDYRLSPDEEKKKTSKDGGSQWYPGWYYVWDEEAIHNRWDKD